MNILANLQYAQLAYLAIVVFITPIVLVSVGLWAMS